MKKWTYYRQFLDLIGLNTMYENKWRNLIPDSDTLFYTNSKHIRCSLIFCGNFATDLVTIAKSIKRFRETQLYESKIWLTQSQEEKRHSKTLKIVTLKNIPCLQTTLFSHDVTFFYIPILLMSDNDTEWKKQRYTWIRVIIMEGNGFPINVLHIIIKPIFVRRKVLPWWFVVRGIQLFIIVIRN